MSRLHANDPNRNTLRPLKKRLLPLKTSLRVLLGTAGSPIPFIGVKTIRYWLEQWLTPEGKTISGKPPANLHGHHHGPQLQAYVLVQHHGCAITQP
ncbi:hypothetical protein J7438_09840 [Thalassotalea sp. G20_0]|uniref:hypothetical protein n=1 Tax=Thalassotalea sp. G20_0 TaxID=2821093 RepID=UPI001AD98848|nr:hypothetical protein [Thalassotalea sp. G20_0]MBO9494383.1 hypothetical protein [Thalassotalea sp. G20_0]